MTVIGTHFHLLVVSARCTTFSSLARQPDFAGRRCADCARHLKLELLFQHCLQTLIRNFVDLLCQMEQTTQLPLIHIKPLLPKLTLPTPTSTLLAPTTLS